MTEIELERTRRDTRLANTLEQRRLYGDNGECTVQDVREARRLANRDDSEIADDLAIKAANREWATLMTEYRRLHPDSHVIFGGLTDLRAAVAAG